jgi:hypothetical protein
MVRKNSLQKKTPGHSKRSSSTRGKSQSPGDSPADAEATFDLETQEAFRQLEKQSETLPKILRAIFLGVAVITLTIAAISSYIAIQVHSREKAARGRVLNLAVRTYNDSSTGDVSEFYYPVVEYSLPGQPPQTAQMSEGSSPPDYEAGDPVIVLVDPLRPHTPRIKSFTSDMLVWILPGITFFLGAAFLTAVIVIYKVWPPGKEEATPSVTP